MVDFENVSFEGIVYRKFNFDKLFNHDDTYYHFNSSDTIGSDTINSDIIDNDSSVTCQFETNIAHIENNVILEDIKQENTLLCNEVFDVNMIADANTGSTEKKQVRKYVKRAKKVTFCDFIEQQDETPLLCLESKKIPRNLDHPYRLRSRGMSPKVYVTKKRRVDFEKIKLIFKNDQFSDEISSDGSESSKIECRVEDFKSLRFAFDDYNRNVVWEKR